MTDWGQAVSKGLHHLRGARTRGIPRGQELTGFIGRVDLLARGRELLIDAGTRLVTLTGTGGVGKTRTAERLAADLATAYRDGTAWVDLTTVDAGDRRLDAAIADRLGLGDNAESPPARDRLINHLRNRHALLVLDNCEHLLGGPAPALVALVTQLVDLATDVQILATSRTPLLLDVEMLLPVPPMTVSHDDDAGSEVSEAVELLMARAHARHVPIADADRPALNSISRRLGGIPLALELIAARLRAVPPAVIDQRLANRGPASALRLLSTGATGGKQPHHRGMDTAIAASYDLLDEDAKLLWAALAQFTGGIDLAAAEALGGAVGLAPDDVLDLITTLVDASVLDHDHHPSHARYHMNEVIRWYGQLAADHLRIDLHALRSAHASHYARMVSSAAEAWFGADELEWLDRVHHALPNLRAAQEFLIDSGDPVQALILAIDYVVSRSPIFAGLINVARHMLDQALAQQPAHPSEPRVIAQALLAFLSGIQGNCGAGLHLLGQARAEAATLGNSDIGPLLMAEGMLRWYVETDLDDVAAVLADFDRARAATPDPSRDNMVTMLAALVAAVDGDEATARLRVEANLAHTRRAGAPWAHCWALTAEAILELRFGEPRRAADILHTALTTEYAAGDTWGTAWGIWLAAIVASTLGEHTTAATLFGAAHTRRSYCDTNIAGMPPWARLAQPAVDASRRDLGDEYDTRYAEGNDLSYSDALTVTLDALDVLRVTPPAADPATALTPRQTEVARLVAEGKTNQQIGKSLGLSDRTVEGHIAAACERLDLPQRTRAALAAHVARA